VRKYARDFFWRITAGTPLFTSNLMLGGVLYGLKKVFIYFMCNLILVVVDIGGSLLVVFVWKKGLVELSYTYLASRLCLFISALICIYTPSNIKQFHLFQWHPKLLFQKKLLLSFVSNNGYLIGRGVILMSTYFLSPVVASRMDTTKLAAHSIAMSLYVYAPAIAESIGRVGNITGANYLGQKKHQLFRGMTISLALVVLLVGLLEFAIFMGAKDILLSSFTSDPKVKAEVESIWLLCCVTALAASQAGLYEELSMARGYFKLLFWAMVVAILVYLPILLVANFKYHELWLVWLSQLVLCVLRFSPVMVAIFWSLRQDRKAYNLLAETNYTQVTGDIRVGDASHLQMPESNQDQSNTAIQ